jgi:hypothetical protein
LHDGVPPCDASTVRFPDQLIGKTFTQESNGISPLIPQDFIRPPRQPVDHDRQAYSRKDKAGQANNRLSWLGLIAGTCKQAPACLPARLEKW